MSPAEIRDVFERTGALQQGHFKLTSGRHSDVYFQKQRVLAHPRVTRSLATLLAARFSQDAGIDVVLSPAVGAIPLGFAVADVIDARFVFAERAKDDELALRRGQWIDRAEHVLVAEDVITTGGSAAECIAIAQAAGARVAGVGALVDRSESPPPFRLEALLRLEATTWDPSECPLCEKGLEIDAPGSRTLNA